jgi:signal transduction histidine kinase
VSVAEIVPDIPRVHTALAEWAACAVYALLLKKRFGGAKWWAAAVLPAGVFIGLHTAAESLPLYLWIPGMAAAITAMHLMIFCLSGSKFFETLFWTARAFVLAEFAASFEWQFYRYSAGRAAGADNLVVEYLFLAVSYAAVFAAVFFLERRYARIGRSFGLAKSNIWAAAGIALTIFLVSNMSFISFDTPLSGRHADEILYIRTLVDFCGLILLYVQQEQRLWLYMRDEMYAARGVLARQYEHYAASKENMEFLNRRYHDLKYQIDIIRAETDAEKKAEYLNELEKGIQIYESEYKTGNRVLDVLLSAKARFCVENGVNFTCVADGALLGFMSVMDICSVVGNALDNASESAMRLPNAEKRLIKMALYVENGFTVLRFENYTEDRPVFENGLPLTSKSDKKNHGYGLKSMKSIAEKYGGVLSARVENNWFTLCISIPLKSARGETF